MPLNLIELEIVSMSNYRERERERERELKNFKPGRNKNDPSGEKVHLRKNDCIVSSINIRGSLHFAS